MKEFKLLKYYPSLPTEWKDSSVQIIVVERETGYQLHPSLKGLTRQLAFPLNKSEVEDSSDFWEDITDPIFITEDKMKLVGGDRYYVPQKEGKLERLSGSYIEFSSFPNKDDKSKKFAKEENAKIYIENNIELFSAKDIHELLKTHSRSLIDPSIYLELSKMVRERLKK